MSKPGLMTGKVMRAEHKLEGPNTVIDLTDCSKGVYFVSITTGSARIVEKIMIH